MIILFFAGISIAALTTISVSPTFAVPFSFSDIPEPVAMLLLGAGMICFAFIGRKMFLKK
jgi:uncharacterized membrane protein YfcA